MKLLDRANNYNSKSGFPESLFIAGDGRIVGMWIMGNDYRIRSNYYGGYPNTYLRRIKLLFPDKQRVLHMFSGKVDTDQLPGDTVDLLPELNPTFVDDCQELTQVPLEQYDLLLCDPPYSQEDADHYGTTMVKRNKIFKTLGKRLTPETHVVWLDQFRPMYRKDQFQLEGMIGVSRSTNHRYRCIEIFRKFPTS